jgi:small neutral amino acid transporter SnatA (MarC family)
MSLGLVVLGFLGVVNPARVRLGLPGDHARPDVLLIGSAIAFAAGLGIAAAASELLSWLDVSSETFRIAAGLVLAVEGAWTLVRPQPGPEPVLPSRLAALVPVSFPLLLTPGLVTLSLAAGADLGVGQTCGALACGLVLLLPILRIERDTRRAALIAPAARLIACLEIIAAAGLALEGLRDV